MITEWSNVKVMITGVCGTVGSEILNQLLEKGCTRIVGIDHNENDLFFLNQKFLDNKNVQFFLCDIEDRESLQMRMRGCDVVLHCAALKHVPMCEASPRTAVGTNIVGIQNVIDAAFINNVKKVFFTSSDKAVNPTNVMGTTKLMGERLMTAANVTRRSDDCPVFGVSRFGNVLGTNGSVIPIFKQQIEAGGPVTVTDENMTRFIMTLKDATNLVLDSALRFKGGEVFITKMPVINILDLAKVMVQELAPQCGYKPEDIEIKIVGPRLGEKMFEELVNTEEVRRTLETRDYFIVKPALEEDQSKFTYEDMPTEQAALPYTSETAEAMTQDELRDFLYEHGLLSSSQEKQPKLKVI